MSILIKNVTDDAFRKYGRVLQGYDLNDLIARMQETPLPSDVIYVASDKMLEDLPVFEEFSESIYGGMPVQIGYCNGHNRLLNAVEYHRSSEINVAVTDMVLLLGSQQDVTREYTYNTSYIEAFLIPQGTIIECYATTLHYAPCGYHGNGFKCVVVLPKGTNGPLGDRQKYGKEDSLLAARNKWLIAHEDAGIKDAFVGLIGENVSI